MRSCKDESKINNQVLQTRMTKKGKLIISLFI